VSDHLPIVLQLDFGLSYKHYPFKFNHHWVEDDDFQKLIRGHWKRDRVGGGGSTMEALSDNLLSMKHIMKRWERHKKCTQRLDMVINEEKISHIFDICRGGIFTELELEELRELELKKSLILGREEAAWRLKSRALWVKCGDQNTHFFHNYASHRRNHNAIWALKDANGNALCTQEDLASTGVNHFKGIFIDRGMPRLEAQMQVLNFFPKYVEEANCFVLAKEVTLKELESILRLCDKEKIPGPDG